jgi:two-component system CheB/CheR fusion protein
VSQILIAAIGASAGGLSAMTDLLEVASCHQSMCFVIVSHLPRFRETDLPKILSRITNLEGIEITDGLKLESCKVYTIPPNKYARLIDGKFVLESRPPDGPNQSADIFFESLSRCCGVNSIGVILSGAGVGQDGAKGVCAIRRAGGQTYVQSPEEALFADMPRAAIQTGCVDSILDAKLIGRELSLLSWVEGSTGDAV